MKQDVRPNAEAEGEFRLYIARYEEETRGLGERLWSEIEAAVELISTHPAVGEAIRRRGRSVIRRVPLRHFPFLLVYRELLITSKYRARALESKAVLLP